MAHTDAQLAWFLTWLGDPNRGRHLHPRYEEAAIHAARTGLTELAAGSFAPTVTAAGRAWLTQHTHTLQEIEVLS